MSVTVKHIKHTQGSTLMKHMQNTDVFDLCPKHMDVK